MPWLPQADVLKIHSQSLQIGLHTKRDLLLGGLPIAYVAQLPIQGDPSGQLLGDLQSMNAALPLAGDVIPLDVWLTNAAHHAALYPAIRELLTNCADRVAKKVRDETSGLEAVAPPELDLDTVQEREIFTNDLLPVGFLAAAQRTAVSVAKLVVSRFDFGQPKMKSGGGQVRYNGTGWLLGSKHMITNHHVVNARDSQFEADASPSDLKLQSESTAVQFDFDSDEAAVDERKVASLAHANKELDYAILELKDDSGRDPLPLWPSQVTLPGNDVIALNIIQHPSGAAKQIGMRNNLAATINDNTLAYFTDTKGGSSGSPVCNDTWQVVALHRAATRTFGEFKFQGKRTEWVNIGTRIDRIIGDLKSNQAQLWSAIGANL